MSVNVCLDESFWTAELFFLFFFPNLVWWCSIMSQSTMWKKKFAIFKVNVTARAHVIEDDSCYYVFWTVDSLATKLGLMIHIIGQSDFSKLLHSRSSAGSECQCLFRWYLLNHQTFCYQTWYCDASSWADVHAEKFVSFFKVSVTARAYMIKIWVSTISAELLIVLLPNLVW